MHEDDGDDDDSQRQIPVDYVLSSSIGSLHLTPRVVGARVPYTRQYLRCSWVLHH
jgi:hypothetical protein